MVDSRSSQTDVTGDSEKSTHRPETTRGGKPRIPEHQLSIRDATHDDAAAIADIYNESIRSGGACLEEDLYSPEGIRQKIASFHDRETILLLESSVPVAGSQGPPASTLGWGIIKRYSDRQGYRFACETAVYLRRHMVGMGLGTRIKLAQIERCRQYRYHHMVAKILATNTASIEYNKKLGYDVVGIQKEIGFQNGRWQDVAILQLVLDTPLPEAAAENDR